jgi:hypothetical protein
MTATTILRVKEMERRRVDLSRINLRQSSVLFLSLTAITRVSPQALQEEIKPKRDQRVLCLVSREEKQYRQIVVISKVSFKIIKEEQKIRRREETVSSGYSHSHRQSRVSPQALRKQKSSRRGEKKGSFSPKRQK